MDKKLNDVEHVKELIALAVEAGLSGSEKLIGMSAEDVASKYNGIGPAWMSEANRRRLTNALKFHEAPCLIHDVVRFDRSDGSTGGFSYANDELEHNCLTLADYKCAWYSPMRYWHRHGGYLIAQTCRLTGWSAWMDAFKARTGKQ